jgi:hypothetical protein
MSCPFKFALGKPNEGIHAPRIFGLALVDIVATFIVAAFTSWLTKSSYIVNLFLWLFLGELLHFMFGTPTAFLVMIGLEPKCEG